MGATNHCHGFVIFGEPDEVQTAVSMSPYFVNGDQVHMRQDWETLATQMDGHGMQIGQNRDGSIQQQQAAASSSQQPTMASSSSHLPLAAKSSHKQAPAGLV